MNNANTKLVTPWSATSISYRLNIDFTFLLTSSYFLCIFEV